MKRKYILVFILSSFYCMSQVGINTSNPNAQLDIRSSNQATPANTDGLLIPKVDAFPAINPTAAQQGMMVYLTTTSSTNLPGFYFWDNPTTSWKTLNNNGSKYYSVIGTTNAVSSNTLEIMPQMTITFTPKSPTVFLNFSAKGFLADASLNPSISGTCRQGAIFFQILVNGVPTKGWQTSVEDISNVVNYPLWDTAIYYPVNVTPNTPQTVSINWYFPSCGGLMANYVSAPINARQAHRSMCIIDPNGGAGVESSVPPVVTEYWNVNGNAGTTATNNFIGTLDNSNLNFRRNNINAGSIGLSNASFGLNSLNPFSVSANNTALGSRALIINSSGGNNTAVGYSSLYQNTIGNFNTALGTFATTNENNLTNASAIGAFARADANNTMVLGSVAGINSATETVQVGIGTTLPESRLHVVGNSIIESENVTTLASTYGNLHIGSVNPHGVNIGASISLGGNTAATGNKRVFGTIEGRKTNFISGSENGYLAFKTLGTGALEERVRITNIGRVGIGTATPGGQFELSLDQGRKPGTATWTIVSDARLKTIKGSYEKGLEEIVKLNPIVYNYKNGSDRKFETELLQKPFAGFLAQDVQKIFPEAVGNDEDGFLNLNIHPILIASINAFRDLKRLNDQLLEENKILKSKLDDVVNRLERLEKK